MSKPFVFQIFFEKSKFTRGICGMAKHYSLNKTKYLLDHEMKKLEELLSSYINKDLRNSLVLTLALKTGARAQEILNLEKGDLNPQEETVFIRGIKNSKDREIPLAPNLFRRLETYAETVEGNMLFPITYNRLLQVWHIYRPVPKKFHSLRHTFAIQLYKKTKDIRLVQLALGHCNITNTMVYADYVYSQQELRRLIL